MFWVFPVHIIPIMPDAFQQSFQRENWRELSGNMVIKIKCREYCGVFSCQFYGLSTPYSMVNSNAYVLCSACSDILSAVSFCWPYRRWTLTHHYLIILCFHEIKMEPYGIQALHSLLFMLQSNIVFLWVLDSFIFGGSRLRQVFRVRSDGFRYIDAFWFFFYGKTLSIRSQSVRIDWKVTLIKFWRND